MLARYVVTKQPRKKGRRDVRELGFGLTRRTLCPPHILGHCVVTLEALEAGGFGGGYCAGHWGTMWTCDDADIPF
jgi:hypothetical protein